MRRRSHASLITTKRIQNIIEHMTYQVFKYSVRGFYEVDKMTFTLLLALKIDMQTGKIKPKEFMTFIKGTPDGKCASVLPDGMFRFNYLVGLGRLEILRVASQTTV